jgi:hypothetical protein
MNYNRLLDIDFISSRLSSDPPPKQKHLRSFDGTPYQGYFSFENDLITAHSAKQEEKLTHISRNTAANLNRDILSPSSANLYPNQSDEELSNELRPLTYIHAYADLHKIQQHPNSEYPCLNKLMRWVCDATKTGKIIIRVHGTAYQDLTSRGYVYEGDTSLSIKDVIECFVTNGLRASHDSGLLGIKRGAKWLNDNSTSMCMQDRCTRRFNLFTRRHHCRRCGGIFCDRHSSKTRSLHEAFSKTAGKTKLNGELVRVCDTCADECDAARNNPRAASVNSDIEMYRGGFAHVQDFLVRGSKSQPYP